MKYEITFEKITKHFLSVEANSFGAAETYVFNLIKEGRAEDNSACLDEETTTRITGIVEDTD